MPKQKPHVYDMTKPKPDESKIRKRNCMTCGAPFRSEGPHNRLCKPCREQTHYDGTA